VSIVDGSLLLAAPVALAAGAVSFASPCVLPLVPGYLSYVTGLSGADLAAPEGAGSGRRRGLVVAGACLFVLGFSVVFTSYGAFFGAVGDSLRFHQRILEQVLGAVTVLLGIAFSGLWRRIPLLTREARWHRLPTAGLASAPVLGVLFAVGWTPCIGPTLSTVLVLSASSDAATAGRGAVLTFVYCLGLGVPFLLTALAFRRALGFFAVIKRHYQAVMLAGGTLLVVVGVLEISGLWATMVIHLQDTFSSYTPVL
jgi:cytochrome c-type biogenesis protein